MESEERNPEAASWRPSLSFDGRYMVRATKVAATGDTNGFRDIVLIDRDRDGDGMHDKWEETFGLNAESAADAAGDPDGDGPTSLLEFEAATHPTATHKRYLAEGAANAFFSTVISIANPNQQPAIATVRLLGGNGEVMTTTHTLSALGYDSLELGAGGHVPDEAFGAVIESTVPVVVDRAMAWDVEELVAWNQLFVGYGAHAEAASSSPSTNWSSRKARRTAISICSICCRPPRLPPRRSR